MDNSNRERRRQDPVNRLRRACYGLMLCCGSAPFAEAAADSTTPHRLGTRDQLPVAAQFVPWGDNDRFLGVELLQPSEYDAWMSGRPIPARGAGRFASDRLPFSAIGRTLLAARVTGDELDNLRKGMGVDLTLPELGTFSFNLYSRSEALQDGKRWRLIPAGTPLPQAGGQNWSLGGSLDVIRGTPDGRRELVFVPQLTMNLNALTGAPGKLDASVIYTRWRCAAARDVTDESPVLQLAVKWWF